MGSPPSGGNSPDLALLIADLRRLLRRWKDLSERSQNPLVTDTYRCAVRDLQAELWRALRRELTVEVCDMLLPVLQERWRQESDERSGWTWSQYKGEHL